MKIFKFGGASVKDAEAIRNVGKILKGYKDEHIVVVVSAMAKTTNALEQVVDAHFYKTGDPEKALQVVRDFHFGVLQELFPDQHHAIYTQINNYFVELEWNLEEDMGKGYNFVYDQVVAVGELLATKIVSEYLKDADIHNYWLDVRDCIRTDNTYREARIDWDLSATYTIEFMLPNIEEHKLLITQGFIGGTSENFTTTLGREGSDYTAAVLAHILDAEGVIIWKDVPGVLNADPGYMKDAVKFEQLSYIEAIELSYYGATVIHPKTIKPLQNKGIPLYVKSFNNPDAAGTIINNAGVIAPLMPSFIIKIRQILISISAADFSFIVEENLSLIFGLFAKHGVKINLMQNSAISFSVCVDHDSQKIPGLISELKHRFGVLFNDQMELVTIRHYTQEVLDTITKDRSVYLEQKSRNTAQYVMKAR